MFVTTFILNTLTKGQHNSNEKSNSDLIFEFEVNLIEFVLDLFKLLITSMISEGLHEFKPWGVTSSDCTEANSKS
jgi:hypothetical protein